MPLSHLNALKALDATLRSGSFKQAAGELGVTPAAVGQQVRALEAWLGHDLFQRDATGITPTPAARRVAARLADHMAGLGDILTDLRSGSDDQRLAVTLPASFAENWLAERIPAYWQSHPTVDLRLNASNRMVDLRSEGFDFAVRYSGELAPHLDAVTLFGDFVVPVCTPTFAARYGLAPDQTSIDGIPLIHLDDRTPDPTWATWDQWAETHDFEMTASPAALRYREVSSGLQPARLEQGLVLAGLVEAYAALASGTLVAPFGTERNCPTSYAYRLVWVRGKTLTPVQHAFIDWMTDSAARFRRSLEQLSGETGHGG